MDFQALIAVLLSWAVQLSGYPMPPAPPAVHYVSHAFLVENACGGSECPVFGWYNDSNVIYIDERLSSGHADLLTSLLVHELTHYLQHRSGRFDSLSCEDSLAREREAYRVQYQYLVEVRGIAPVYSPRRASCNYAGASAALPAAEP